MTQTFKGLNDFYIKAHDMGIHLNKSKLQGHAPNNSDRCA